MGVESYFRQKRVLVTGASSGIGLATAKALAPMGAELTLVARRGPTLEQIRDELRPNATRPIHVLPLDISDEAAVERQVPLHVQAHGVDVLINNAGIAMPGRFLELDKKHFRELMEVNYFGAVYMCRAIAPHMVKKGQGHIANVGSLLSVMSVYGYSAYAATKFALYGFSDALRGELRPHGIQVSILLPPDTDTPQHSFEMPHLPAETRAIAGTVKMLSAEEVAMTLLRNMAKGKFEIIPGWDARLTAAVHRIAPGLVRWYCDAITRKTAKNKSTGSMPKNRLPTPSADA